MEGGATLGWGGGEPWVGGGGWGIKTTKIDVCQKRKEKKVTSSKNGLNVFFLNDPKIRFGQKRLVELILP